MAKRKVHIPDFDEESSLQWLDYAKYIAACAGMDLPEGVDRYELRIMAEAHLGGCLNVPALMVLSALGDSERGSPISPFQHFRDR